MSDFTTKHLYQHCVYWSTPTPTASATYTYAEPVELDCRWEAIDLAQLSALGVNSNVASIVYLAQDVEENGMLLLGEVADLDSSVTDDPLAAGASLIIKFDKVPSIKADKYLRKAYVGVPYTGRG